MSADGGDDEFGSYDVPGLYLGSNAPLDEVHVLSIHLVAKATVDAVVREAVEDLTRAVAGATQWLAGAVRGEMISQAVADAESRENNLSDVKEEREQPSPTEPFEAVETLQRQETLQSLTRVSSAAIHAVAKATVDAATDEALKEVVQAVERATEWFSQAVENELVAESVDPDEGVAFHDATEWITQAARSELIAHAVVDATPSETPPASHVEQSIIETPEVATALDAPRLSSLVTTGVRELAEVTAEAAVSKALENVARASGEASQWLTHAVSEELLAEAVVDAPPEDEPHADGTDINCTGSTDSEEPQQPSPLAEVETYTTSVYVPALRIPNAVPRSPERAAECHELAVPFVNGVLSSALHHAIPASSPEPQEYADDAYEDYTPINSPTSEDNSPLPSTRSPEQDTPQDVPPAILSGRATPPDTTPTPRRKSPITSKRGLGTPSSAPPAMPSSRVGAETSTEEVSEPPPSTLPPLVLPEVQLTGRTKHRHLKTPQKTPRHSSSGSNVDDEEEAFTMDTSCSSTSRPNEPTSRASVAVELELTPMSSARAAALIYAQQPPSSSRHHRQHHHHKPKKLRDSASQTSPPPSPSLTSLPRQPLVGAREGSNVCELPKTQTSHSKHSPRGDRTSPENGVEKKAEGSNNSLLAPLSKTPAMPPSADSSTTKSSSPSRSLTSHGLGHRQKGGSGSSPSKRSGYCQRCVFEGRSCKINDCLKHQVLK
ncbi:hypothetical protein PHYPSEUDO_000796 [Phytophthora pseudosyringae]|uniref:Uncharacterized protein n=1 Tax=Phytophthora pseudosyringae TaxID=221518 RepID=A0A8T1WIN2_9STRA|nr:hypothetical protein PHYPSEUDO_000796 [Phytophthora pseudosyringae]